MHQESISYLLFLIFAGSAILATLALFARQALIVAYIVLGILLGPSLINAVPDPYAIEQLSETGIIFLLFLLGLNLHPQKLYLLFSNTLFITLASCLLFASIGLSVSLLFGFSFKDAIIIGVCMMFSSTIIGLKLLPTTVLHHQHMGELIISILLLQDIIAILALLVLKTSTGNEAGMTTALLPLIGLPTLVVIARLLEKYLITPLIARFDTIQEYIFLLVIGWCLGMAELAHLLGLSSEIGAFVAGVAIAATPISTFVAESLKPVRDFFLVLFFFALGAHFDPAAASSSLLPALILTLLLLAIKPIAFKELFQRRNESRKTSKEIGFRLGQISEFSLLISMAALHYGQLTSSAAYLIQSSVIISFILSPYLIVLRYPTPIAIDEKLRRD